MPKPNVRAVNDAVEEQLIDDLDAFLGRLNKVWDRLAEKGQLDARGGNEWRRVMRHVHASLTDPRALEKALLTWAAVAE